MKQIFFYIFVWILATACKNRDTKTVDTPPPVNNDPVNIPYRIVKEYPHDTLAFTEGLQYVNGKLYESVGLNGHSDIRITDLQTGKTLQSHKLEPKYFGEGVTVLNGKAYQLTYQENTAFVYDAATFKPLATFTYNFGEGWGMTTDGKNLIISTGSSNLYYVDPATFKVLKTIPVYNQYGAVAEINELEFIKGFVYANRWKRDIIMKINPATGQVVGNIDFNDLRARYGFPPFEQAQEGQPEVLNGIAYDSANNRIFITGKLWPKLFEVKLDN